MCLLFLCQGVHQDWPLILLANRDEFHARPTRAAQFWRDAPALLAGRDLQRGGTWLGVTRSGRFAALTNFREPSRPSGKRSRGDIVRDYLTGPLDAQRFAERLQGMATQFDGFNLLFGDRRATLWLSNRGGEPRRLGTGIYGLSNHLLETPWPKVTHGKRRLAAQLTRRPVTDRLFEPLTDTRVHRHDLPNTGLAPDTERMLSSAFVTNDEYGTRSSALLMMDATAGVYFEERSYDRGDGCDRRPDRFSARLFRFRLD